MKLSAAYATIQARALPMLLLVAFLSLTCLGEARSLLTAQPAKTECLAHLQLCRMSRQRGEGAAGAAAGLWAASAQRLLISSAMDTRPVTRPRCGRIARC